MSGDYDFDASIQHCSNRSVPAKLGLYLKGDHTYSPRSAYSGYRRHGDD